MDIKTDRLIKIASLGINTKMARVLDYFFDHSAANSCIQVEPAQAQVIILDIDSIDGKKLFNNLPAQYQDKVLIVLSVKQPPREDLIHVKKPFKAEILLSAIDQARSALAHDSRATKAVGTAAADGSRNGATSNTAGKTTGPASVPRSPANAKSDSNMDTNLSIIQQNRQELEKTWTTKTDRPLKLVKNTASVEPVQRHADTRGERIIGSAPDIDLDDPEELYNRSYNPSDYLQGFLNKTILKAKHFNKPVLQTISEFSIIVLPKADTVLSDARETQLQALSSIPLSDKTMTEVFLEEEQLKKYSVQTYPVPLYDLLWKSALIASRGRIPVKTDLYAPIVFSHWSKISDQVLLFKHAETIATLWQRRPLSLVETLHRLRIPQRYVFAFYSASKAVGLVSSDQVENRQHNTQEFHETSTSKAKKNGIMNKLFNKFR